MKTKFLSVCFGISIVVFSIGFLIRSISPVQAQNMGGTLSSDSKNGKYQMQLSSFVYNTTVYYRILVWDTETGRSRQYVSSSGSPAWEVDDQNLPNTPL